MTNYENARPVRRPNKRGPVAVLLVLLVVVGAVSALATYFLVRPGHQADLDRCTAQAVRTYPTVDEMKVADLKACDGLSEDELADVRKQLQDFILQGTLKIGEKLGDQPLDPSGAGEINPSPERSAR